MKKTLPILMTILIIAIQAQAASPDVNVITPNGGETLTNTYNIEWELADADGNDLNADLYYSLNAGDKTWQIKNDYPIDGETCVYFDETLDENTTLISGLPSNTYPQPSMAIFYLDVNPNDNIDANLFMVEVAAPNGDNRGYDWNGTEWLDDNAIAAGLFNSEQKPVFVEILDLNGTQRLLLSLGAGDPYIYDWNGTQWVRDSNLSTGLPNTKAGKGFFQYNGNTYLLWSNTDRTIDAYQWTGSQWNINHDFNKGLEDVYNLFHVQPYKFGLSPWTDSINNLHVFVSDVYIAGGQNIAQIHGLDWNGESWEYNPDLNNNIPDIAKNYIYPEVFQYDTDTNKRYLMIGHSGTGSLDYGEFQAFQFDSNQNTQSPVTCTYPWDTTFINDGNYYIDIEVTDGTDTNTDSSDNSFSIDNLNESDVNNISLCQSIVKNGPTDEKIDVGFIGSGFPSRTKFAEVVNEMIDYNGNQSGLMSEEPFKSNKEKFNFWRLDFLNTYVLTNIDILKEILDNAPFADLDFFCPNLDQRVVLSVNPKFGAYAYADPSIAKGKSMTVVTIGDQYLQDCQSGELNCTAPWPLRDPNPVDANYDILANNKIHVKQMFTHEFGHAFGGLADEYDMGVAAPENKNIDGYVNCDNNTCSKWDGVSGTSCIAKCGYTDWYRAFDFTLMGDHMAKTSLNYEIVNENELSNDINNAITNPPGFDPLRLFSMIFHMTFQSGNMLLDEIELALGNARNYPIRSASYNLEMRDSSGQSMYDINFDIPDTIIFAAPGNSFDENGNYLGDGNLDLQFDLNDINFTIIIPYDPTAKTADITDENGALLVSFDVSRSSPINNSTVYRSGKETNESYALSYSLSKQPIGTFSNSNYNLKLGPIYYTNQNSN